MNLPKSDADWKAGQAADDVVTIGDPRLSQPTESVGDAADAQELLDGMVRRLRALNGAGLAAPQLGAPVRAVVIEVRKTDVFPDRPTSPLLQLINPTIIERSADTDVGWEGCFSVPGLMGQVARASAVTVRYTTPAGREQEDRFTGYLARVAQHEIDHLDGIEFLDRMTSLKSLTTVHNYTEFHR